MALPENFDTEVFAVVAEIPAGCVVTYGQIARLTGMPGYARHVGKSLGHAPASLPCHRVVNSTGRTAPGWSAQRALLETEGVRFKANGCADIARAGWKEASLFSGASTPIHRQPKNRPSGQYRGSDLRFEE